MGIFDKFFSFLSSGDENGDRVIKNDPEKQAALKEFDLALYYTPTCPYCVKVLGYLEQEGITLPMKNVFSSAEERQELINVGGKSQVPCLFIDGKALYESDDIICWLQEKTK